MGGGETGLITGGRVMPRALWAQGRCLEWCRQVFCGHEACLLRKEEGSGSFIPLAVPDNVPVGARWCRWGTRSYCCHRAVMEEDGVHRQGGRQVAGYGSGWEGSGCGVEGISWL